MVDEGSRRETGGDERQDTPVAGGPEEANPLINPAAYEETFSPPPSLRWLAIAYVTAAILLAVGAVAAFLNIGVGSAQGTWGLGLLLLAAVTGIVAIGIWAREPWGWFLATGATTILLLVSVGAILQGSMGLGLVGLVLAAVLGLTLALPTVRHNMHVGTNDAPYRTS